jgi:thiamine-phosphate pyrophosphorylase
MTNRALLRLIDANLNRALEGSRVCEDLVRFGLESPELFRRTRRLRHAIAGAGRALPVGPAARAACRDSRADVGRRARPTRVASTEQSLLINLQRVKEALRCLEEAARLLSVRSAVRFQQLRFATYGLERDLLLHVAPLRHH